MVGFPLTPPHPPPPKKRGTLADIGNPQKQSQSSPRVGVPQHSVWQRPFSCEGSSSHAKLGSKLYMPKVVHFPKAISSIVRLGSMVIFERAHQTPEMAPPPKAPIKPLPGSHSWGSTEAPPTLLWLCEESLNCNSLPEF